MSIIVRSRHTGIGAWVNSNLYTSILYNFINFHARVLYKHTGYTGSLGYNSVCYITSRIRWVFKEKAEQMYPVMGGKKNCLGGIKGCKKHLVPSPSETWFRDMSVGGSFRRE